MISSKLENKLSKFDKNIVFLYAPRKVTVELPLVVDVLGG